ncbi:hypothetical protein HZ994_13600 [Akkermansiaceae bacterium]|nr:hypothetical protein HZ994_13600 [Akkermansiaceae bacterium]
MEKSLIIDLATLPEEGKAFSGELDGSLFDLPKGDALSVGPLAYDLWVQRFESELLATGSVSAPFEFTCVVTLKPFVKTIRLPNAAVSVEIGHSGRTDLAEALREEILIEFPTDPRCDEGDVPEPCEIDSRYLAVDKPGGDGLSIAPRSEGDDRWSALNDLTGLNDQS